MKNKFKIPLHHLIFFAVIIILIIFRFILDGLSLYVNLANYISMLVSILGVWITTISKSIDGRNKNICKSVFIIFLLIFVASGVIILLGNFDIPIALNDVFTLIALLFCICNSIPEILIKKIFSLEYSKEVL
jgi:hypothetical protein